ncbi:TPA: proline--tRNA ligase [Candidatus Uhrbacteria bacterium]|nr:proline--tRNA ligase [Candidatus Uhrbacteria bacterium]
MAKRITLRSEDYSQWYLDVIAAADMAEHSPVKGCMVIKPHGYAIWEMMQKILDLKFKEIGVENAYFPLLIPQSFLSREAEHVEGFAPEVATVTHAGGKKLEEPLVIRPTSETIIYEVFSNWIHSYRDLPLLINQWANVVRWEMRTRLFLRTTEFLWQEGHTAHATHDDADAFARKMLDVYVDFAENTLAVPVIPGQKSDSERFAGALRTYCIEAMMQDGKALQFGTSHNLGQNFAEAFKVKFSDENNVEQFVWQTSWGVSTRMIGGLIMTHSDDQGLVLPPRIAAVQAVIIPLWFKDEEKATVIEKAQSLLAELTAAGVRAKVDLRDGRPGEKLFHWEKKGIPVRIEIGPKDIAAGEVVVARRDTSEKQRMAFVDVATQVAGLMETIQQNLFDRAAKHRADNTVVATNWDDFVAAIEAGKFVLAHWSGDALDEKKIKTETNATIRCIPFSEAPSEGTCVFSSKPSTQRVIFARNY